MDSSNQSNTGLLKFRSATSSLFDYGVLVDNKTTNSDSERLFSRFCDESESPVENSFRELDDKSTVVINQRKFGPGLLPPHYPRQSLSSNENGSFGLVTSSAAMENHHQSHHSQVKASLLRQNSSPAGLFSHIPNGDFSFLSLLDFNLFMNRCYHYFESLVQIFVFFMVGHSFVK